MSLSDKLRQSVLRLVEATVNKSWSGAQRPEEQPGIELELVQAKMEFEGLLAQIDQACLTSPDALRKLQAAHYEMTCLLPRLTPQFANNLAVARQGLKEVIDTIQKEK